MVVANDHPGIATPLVLSMTEGRSGNRSITRFGSRGEMGLSLVAAGVATATVLFLVFLSAPIGLVLLAGYLVIDLLILPRSMADVGSLPVRPLDPPAEVLTVLLVMSERSTDGEVFELIVALNDAPAADPDLSVAARNGHHRLVGRDTCARTGKGFARPS